jgi:hypothetical protein
MVPFFNLNWLDFTQLVLNTVVFKQRLFTLNFDYYFLTNL